MLSLLLLVHSLLAPATASAAPAKGFSVVERDHPGGKLVVHSHVLPNLGDSGTFSGTHFKIVEATSDNAIAIGSDLDLSAASVYYHLERAITFAEAEALKYPTINEGLSRIKFPVTIRINMENEYSSASHWSHVSTRYNTSYTIPGGSNPTVGSWNDEIWFFKSKREEIPSTTTQVFDLVASEPYRTAVFEQLTTQDMVQLGQKLAYQQEIYWPAHLINIASSLAIAEGVLPLMSSISSLFPSQRYCDTAMIPEAVTHEFGHLLFKPHLDLFNPSAIVEGYPNYFASRMAQSPVLAQKLGKISKNFSKKDGRSKYFYSLAQENGLAAATGSFVFSLLYQVEQALGPVEGPKVIYGALNDLDRSSSVSPELTDALMLSASAVGTSPTLEGVKIQQVRELRGL